MILAFTLSSYLRSIKPILHLFITFAFDRQTANTPYFECPMCQSSSNSIRLIDISLKQLITMKNNPFIFERPSKPQDKIIFSRKESMLKQNSRAKSDTVQLPRFYSSQQKSTKKQILQFQQENKPFEHHHAKASLNLKKKESIKYAKTQKNQSPIKIKPLSLKRIKIDQQKFSDILLRGKESFKSFGKEPHNKKLTSHESEFDEQYKFHGLNKQGKVITNSNSNLNKIRYKKVNEGHVMDLVQTETAVNRQPIIANRQPKNLTQETPKWQKKTQPKNKISLKNQQLFLEYLKQTNTIQTLTETNVRAVSHFQNPAKPLSKLNAEQTDFLLDMQQILKKTVKDPNNLDHPEAYIVCEKIKYEKYLCTQLEEKNRKHYRHFIILTRISLYLCAHYILLSLNAKQMLAVLNKIHQNQLIFTSMLGVNEQKRIDRFYSQHKQSIKSFAKKTKQQPLLVIDNRGHSIQRNNDIIKSTLKDLLNKKTMPFRDLFLSFLNSSSEKDSFEYIGFLDKTMKWEVLKMPTFPFLPATLSHKHYLILDLDETLIHFDQSKQLFHIRPFAEEFLKNLSPYYEITIFTAATKQYADDILNEIDKTGCIQHRLYRNHLTFLEGESLKDISMLGREMKTTLIVDNLQSNFRLHQSNGILIKSWYGDSQDSVLNKLQTLLIKIVFEYGNDLRQGLKVYERFITEEITDAKNEHKIKYQL